MNTDFLKILQRVVLFPGNDEFHQSGNDEKSLEKLKLNTKNNNPCLIRENQWLKKTVLKKHDVAGL